MFLYILHCTFCSDCKKMKSFSLKYMYCICRQQLIQLTYSVFGLYFEIIHVTELLTCWNLVHALLRSFSNLCSFLFYFFHQLQPLSFFFASLRDIASRGSPLSVPFCILVFFKEIPRVWYWNGMQKTSERDFFNCYKSDQCILDPIQLLDININFLLFLYQKTVRLMVNYHSSQKAVVRVNPFVPLQTLIPVICDKCDFDPSHVLLLKDSISHHELPLDESLTELGIKELYVLDQSLGKY